MVGMRFSFVTLLYLSSVVFGLQTIHRNDDSQHSRTQMELNSHREIKIEGNDIVADGKKIHILSGSIHYFRTPSAYWADRLRKLKAAGLNTVSTYVEWSFHEPEYRKYNFEGDRDIAHFIRLAAEEGLHVLLRPGPYICAERDLGGFPYWLLSKYPKIQLRSTDEDFISETKTWFEKLFEHITPSLFGNGGPIIFVQVENEYGSYGSDKVYMQQLRDVIKGHVGQNAILYTTDGYSLFKNGNIDGALTTVDFGTYVNVPKTFKELSDYMPVGPKMNSEYYPGWLTHWGEHFQNVDTNSVVKTLKDLLDYGAHINFYVFYGGTNFEFTSGANYQNVYQPDITSYDYGAPLSEAGDPTPKYFAIRNALEQYFPEIRNLTPPSPSRKGSYGTINVQPKLELLSQMGREVLGIRNHHYKGRHLPTFEKLQQRAGLILYETIMDVNHSGIHTLKITKPRDRVYVYLDGKFKGFISRMDKLYDLPLIVAPNVTLSLLVENQGRINFGPKLHDFKGINPVIIGKKVIDAEWRITGYPLEDMSNVTLNIGEERASNAPLLYEGHFSLPAGEEPRETFLNTSGWGKGMIWINGHNLGRYWPSKGPQVTLYVPGVWLKPAPAQNQLLILELESPASDLSVKFIDYPIFKK